MMSEYSFACISIVGTVSAAQFAELSELIKAEGLSDEIDDVPFDPERLVAGEPLRLHHYNASYGTFEALEQYCCNQGIAYRRWCAACTGVFDAERVIFDGNSGPLNYSTDDDDHIMLHVQTIMQLGSMRAIRSYIKPADFDVPPLVVVTEPVVSDEPPVCLPAIGY
jgi:hypothetical protein